MEYNAQEIKAGLMISISVVLLIFFLVATSGLNVFDSNKTYIARFKDTKGIEIGSTVRFGGMDVGKIKELKIYEKDDSYIEFLLEIDEKIPIKINSETCITSIGLMGENHINISTGTPDASLLPPGSLLKCKEILSIAQMMEPAGNIAEQINTTLKDVRELFSAQNQNEFRTILINLNLLLDKNQKTITTMMENTNSAIIDLGKLTEKIDNILVDNESNISSSMKYLEETLYQTKNLINNVNRMVIDLDNIVLNKGTNLTHIVENLKRTTDNLEEFSRSIKERPWQLIRKSAPNEREVNF